MRLIDKLLQKRKERIEKRANTPQFGFFQRFASTILIFLLFLTQTIHVDFFDSAVAESDEYRDIVSIIVDDETYSALGGTFGFSNKVSQYAEDIQKYLGNTRVALLVVPTNADPAVIAAHNEKLYYEGDGGAGVSHLVGTILIGNVPLPVVSKNGKSFPSLYPYTDFDDKQFIYDKVSKRYEYSKNAREDGSVDVWHGVINPSLGRAWQGSADTAKISQFLDKTHAFYSKKWMFSPSSTTLPPRVFYYDGYSESRSLSQDNLFRYLLFLQNTENIAYKRFTKYLLKDLSSAMKVFAEKNRDEGDEYAAELTGTPGLTLGADTLEANTLDTLPDGQTSRLIGTYLKRFHEIINEKTLGDAAKWVHNAGRYNSGTTVRVDHAAVDMTLTDEVALRTLKEANDTIEANIDALITKNNYARKLILFDGLEHHIVSSGATVTTQANTTVNNIIALLNLAGSNTDDAADDIVGAIIGSVLSGSTNGNIGMKPPTPPENTLYTKIYLSYFFGEKTGRIESPLQCTLARGGQMGNSLYGKAVLVEANTAYDLRSTESHVATLSGDTIDLIKAYGPSKSCFPQNGGIKTQSYWGGNSPLSVLTNSGTDTIDSLYKNLPNTPNLTKFSLPIFSLGGMKETRRFAPPSVADCMPGNSYEYTLLQPYIYPVTIEGVNTDRTEMREWPRELGRFTCITEHESLDEDIPSFSGSITDYSQSSCLRGSLILDAKYFDGEKMTDQETALGNICKIESDSTSSDNTRYENRYYHTINSLVKHTSPTDTEIQAIDKNGSTPSTPVDIVRTVEFLTPRGNIAKLTYPNFFALEGSSIGEVRAWLTNLSNEWNAIIAKENTTTLSPLDEKINTLIGAGTLPTSPIDWNSLISDEMILQILQAKYALRPDPVEKYKSSIETTLSYSHEYGLGNIKNPPKIPRSNEGYEIAYLGLTPLDPTKGSQNSDTDTAYQSALATLQAINFSEEEPGDQNPANRASSQCGPPDGVMIFQWPAAILCWIRSLLPPKILAGSCGPNTLGLSSDGKNELVPMPSQSGALFSESGSTSSSLGFGSVDHMMFTSLSNTMIAGSESAGVLRLENKDGGIVAPELHTLEAKIDGGYFIDTDESKKTSLTLDTIESELVFRYGSTGEGPLHMTFSLENGIRYEITLGAKDVKKVQLVPQGEIFAGGGKVKMQVRLIEDTNTPITGFHGVVGLSSSPSVGTFSREAVTLQDGVSEEFEFTPGRTAGDHEVSLDIPGVGIISARITLLPGASMYIDSSISESEITFFLRDRYGNIAKENLTATLEKDGSNRPAILFNNGIATLPREPGLYTISAPEIAGHTITYRDETGEKVFKGIPTHTRMVNATIGRYNFLPDYNALYTVLAGDTHLPEASQILYDTDPSRSRSLAVTTLTASPYARDALFSIFPGGGYLLGNPSDGALEVDTELTQGGIVLSVYDRVAQTPITRVLYPLSGMTISSCSLTGLGDISSCESLSPESAGGRLTLVIDKQKSDTSISNISGATTLLRGGNPRVTILSQGITLASALRFVPNTSLSRGSLVLDIEDNGEKIGMLIVSTDQTKGVQTGAFSSSTNTLTLSDTHAYTLESIPYTTLDGPRGYMIVRDQTSSSLDTDLLGPTHIDSLGALSETPGVGWGDKNRLLLSFAGGDTVGQASRWYHTYTMINLGDPVAHGEKGAPGTETAGVDRSIGIQIAGSENRQIRSVSHKDMDGDQDEDIVVVYDDGFIDLFANTSGKFRRKQMIAYLPDISTRGIDVGDFTGDHYGDILGVNNSGSFLLVDNDKRKFSKGEITLTNSGTLPVGVSQYKIFDMDADWRDDIVYLTEGGELGILYGGATRFQFTQKILESHLGITLSPDPIVSGGALQASTTPSTLPSSLSTSTGADDSVLNTEVFYERATNSPSTPSPLTDATDTGNITDAFAPLLADGALNGRDSSGSTPSDIYVRSEYISAYGLSVEKTYTTKDGSTLSSGDTVEVRIRIRNTGNTLAKDIRYLDTIPQIFDATNTTRYNITLDGKTEERDMLPLSGEDYDYEFRGVDLSPGKELTISYELRALPTSYGEMIVDHLEKGLAGDDIYGDVAFDTSTTCGADIILWSSLAAREYERGTRTFGPGELPPSLAGRLQDSDRNGIADTIENTSTGQLESIYHSMGDGASLSTNSLFSANYDTTQRLASLGFSAGAEANIESIAQNIANGLACGFGGGSCIAFPINFTTNMPGSAISILGMPVIPPTPITGIPAAIPLFSSVTFCGPFSPPMWPPCPIGAGGSFGPAWGPVRVFAGVTATLAAGVAVCTGPNLTFPAINPLYPLLPAGNCIIAAKPLPVCKGDGSSDDGDVSGLAGLGSLRDTWNSASCHLRASARTEESDTGLRNDIISYLKNPSLAGLSRVNTLLQNRGGRTTADLGGPLLRMGDSSTSGTAIDITLDSAKPLTAGNIIKVRNRRIAGFPEFIMDWVARQTNEITNKLLTLPNLVIVLPKGVTDGSFSQFLEKFHTVNVSGGIGELKTKMGSAYTNTLNQKQAAATKTSGAQSTLQNTLAYGEASASSLKAAYQFIGQIPFVRIEQEAVPINIPWILPSELDQYARALDAYKAEIERAKKSWCVGKDPTACLDEKTNIGLGALSSSIEKNLKTIEEWKRFPEKIQKYLTWKQRYIAQLLCNVEALEKMIGGWYRDNGVRFRKWAEFYVLMKAIVSTWQPLIDIFRIKDEECSVCRNERWDLKYFKFKLLSAVIPQLPIIQFPRWPDIVLDLSDIRFGIVVKVPDFRFNISPIRLPRLPVLTLPSLPTLTLNLPPLPTLPALPTLPDLPGLPSLPRINLPSLPPPPKIPKLFGAVATVLKMLKLLAKIYCLIQKTPLVPEDYVGTLIAQRTDRQMTLPFDFLSVRFPQIAIPSIREIRVSTHVNFELRSDFIATLAKAAVKPINQFTADLVRSVPSTVVPDVNLSPPPNINITPRSSTELPSLAKLEEAMTLLIAKLQKDNDTLLDTDEFHNYLRQEMLIAGLDTMTLDRMWKKAHDEVRDMDTTIEKERIEQFRLLKKYLNIEVLETKEQQKNLEKLYNNQHLLTEGDFAQFVSGRESLSNQAYHAYETAQSGDFSTREYDDTSTIGSEFIASKERLIARLENGGGGTSSSPESTAGGLYQPIYDGVYVLLGPEKKQTKLFDYTDLLESGTRVDTLDIDGDGDNDYMYLLGGSLYIKYTHSPSDRPTPVDTTNTSISYDASLFPRAPNFFHELPSSPGQIEVEFSPASPTDHLFRLEFFDRYLEWDSVAGRSDDPSTPRTTIDLVVDVPGEQTSSYERKPITRVIESISDPESFALEGMSYSVLDQGQKFGLSAGRTLSTGKTSAQISYSIGSGPIQTLSLDPYSQYRFPMTLSGTVIGGKAYVLAPSSLKVNYSPDMIGMPLSGDARIFAGDGEVKLSTPSLSTTILVSPGTEYREIHLGSPRDMYSVTFPYQDGFYSARLRSLQDSRDVRAGVTLIAPQASLDRSPPVLDVSGDYRVPVYQTLRLELSDIVTDMSPYTLSIDRDTTRDSDGNGESDDDFEIITGGDLVVGPFSRIGRENIMIRATDNYGNTTTAPVAIEVYAPIPSIQNASLGGTLSGILDEALSQEPIDIFRIREGSSLIPLFSGSLMTGGDGVFSTGGFMTQSGARLSYSGGSLMISEKSGLSPLSTSMNVVFVPASREHLMYLSFRKDTREILREYLLPPEQVPITESLSGSAPSIIIEHSGTTRLIPAPFDDPGIAGGYYITLADKKAIFALDRRGQIYTLDPTTTFSLSEKDGYLAISLGKGGNLIATLTYKVAFFYTAKK